MSSEKLRSSTVRVGQLIFGYRDYLFPILFMLLIATTTPAFPLGSERLDHWMDGLGLVGALLGQGCRLLAVASVHNIRRRGHHKQIAAESLIRTGVFAATRNPLYLGNLLICGGLVLIANSYWWYVLALPACVGAYWAIIFAEEEFLCQQFAQEYEDYCRAVPRFVPTVNKFRQSLGGGTFDWQRAARKEARILCSWGSLVVALFIWERWAQFGFATRRGEIVFLLCQWLLTMSVVYSALWWWKRR
jgi:protein-S-isoprenylcysteine O-methyltransferase Ste14